MGCDLQRLPIAANIVFDHLNEEKTTSPEYFVLRNRFTIGKNFGTCNPYKKGVEHFIRSATGWIQHATEFRGMIDQARLALSALREQRTSLKTCVEVVVYDGNRSNIDIPQRPCGRLVDKLECVISTRKKLLRCLANLQDLNTTQELNVMIPCTSFKTRNGENRVATFLGLQREPF